LYFTQIKTYFGQSTHDQLVDEFLPNSNLYLDKLVLNEWHIYGSSRLGIYKANVLVASKEVRINTTSPNGQNSTTSDYNTLLTDAPILAFDTYSQTRGAKNYELSNHLGNVLVVITDKKYNCINNEVYGADFKIGKGGFTGGWSEQNSGWSTTFTGPYSTVINDKGRLKTTATVTYGGNRNVVNTTSGKSYTFTFDLDIGTTTGIYVNARATNGSSPYTGTNLAQIYVTASGTYTLTFTAASATTQLLFEKGTYGSSYFYIDNARVAETDVTTYNYYVADVVTANDYSPFGAPLAGRSYTAPNSDYRFAFNGKENDYETQTQDYGFRIYDYRLGRFLSVDPITKNFPELTPYQFASNTPLMAVDMDGLEAWYRESGDVLRSELIGKKYPISIINYNSPKAAFGPYSISYMRGMGLALEPTVILPTVIVGKNSTHVEVKSCHQDEYSPSTDIYAGMSFVEGTLKTSGVVLTVVGLPEVGVPLFSYGDAVDDMIIGLKIIDAALAIDKTKGITEIVAKSTESIIQQGMKKVGKLGGVDEIQEFAADVLVDKTVDVVKGKANEAQEAEENK
jgi:RHS repeat-associated protein